MVNKPILLIHGTWGSARSWDAIRDDLSQLDLDVIAPSLRHHDLPYDEAMNKVGDVNIRDYVDDIVHLVNQLETPPVLLGHSLGCLIAQLVAERVKVSGLILLGPAPTGDIFKFYPTMIRSFIRHFTQWGFWYKPMPPYKNIQFNYAMQTQSPRLKEKVFREAVPESGLVYTQMAFPYLDHRQSVHVNFEKIHCPVLVITGSQDRMTVPQIAKATAKNYGNQATLIKISGADHYYIAGKFKATVVFHIKRWLKRIEHDFSS